MSDQSERVQKSAKVGDRLWVWLADPPSEFETMISNHLTSFDKDNEVFYVQAYLWVNMPTPSEIDITSHLPNVTELPQVRAIGVFKIEEEIKVKLPTTDLTFSDSAPAGQVNISSREIAFCNQLLLVIACRQVDHDSGHASLRGALDTIGYLSLVFGHCISEEPVFSAYFNTKTNKFICGMLGIQSEADIEKSVFGVKSFYQLDEFAGDDAKVHASMWFAGKAFTERDTASKIIFYNTALELICGKRMQDYFRSLYKGEVVAPIAIRKIKNLQDLRGNLVHRGELGEFSSESERYVQLLLLDAIMNKQQGELPKSAIVAALDGMQATEPGGATH